MKILASLEQESVTFDGTVPKFPKFDCFVAKMENRFLFGRWNHMQQFDSSSHNIKRDCITFFG